MRKILLLAATAFVTVNCQAVTVFTANLTTSQETSAVVPTTSTGDPRPVAFGTATFTLDDAMTSLTFSATIFNLDVTGTQTPDSNDNLTAAHIHAGATAVPGQNAPVVWGFFGTPFNDTTPNDATATPFATGVGGAFTGKWDLIEGNNTTLAAQLPNILSGHSYINFHTRQFGGGEIRGAIIPPTTTVPDGGSTGMLLLAGLTLLGVARRKF